MEEKQESKHSASLLRSRYFGRHVTLFPRSGKEALRDESTQLTAAKETDFQFTPINQNGYEKKDIIKTERCFFYLHSSRLVR